MFKSLLVPLTGGGGDAETLDAALAVARQFRAHIDAVHAHSDIARLASRTIAGSEMPVIWTPEIVAAIQEETAGIAKRARSVFDAFVAANDIAVAKEPASAERLTASYAEIEGNPIRELCSHARVHDLAICGRKSVLVAEGSEIAADVLVRSGRPLLLPPDNKPTLVGQRVVIAWKDAVEAARAVTAALPFILKAERVFVVTVAEEGTDAANAGRSADGLVRLLRCHGKDAELRPVGPIPDVADTILDAALAVKGDLLVMGGYGHSRVREFLFGGVTRRVLHGAPLAVFLAH
ncbi:MAG TPA: universal stress protein [Rhizomicrobium sp.]|nr:universal stress protein [Rhizomicrobium sp.]